MNETMVTQYIIDTFGGVDVLVASGDSYFFYDPDRSTAPDHRFPFATLVTGDRHDQFSNLDRPSVFRLNIGVCKQTFGLLFSSQPSDGGHDFTAMDRIMPHPVYGKMYWVCVLNPGEATFEAVRPLLTEAYDLAAGRHARTQPADEAD
ncbi:MAG: hypothetical protein JWO38_2894 [Gemmataceae bacterium]|nr:hypothetical protein [Gemmataceae bacterium]